MSPTIQTVPIPGSPSVPGHLQTITQWTQVHGLSAAECDRLKSVLVEYPPVEVTSELNEELQCILADRKLASMPKLTAADVDKARLAFESGLLPFVRQEVD